MSTTTQPASSPYLPVRDEWLARRTEAILEPDLPIVDPHHHLWERPGWRYMLDDLLADTNSGHNIVATVFVQCRSMHRAVGPGGAEAGRRDRVRQRRRGDERGGRLRQGEDLRGHRRAMPTCGWVARARGAGGAYPRRRRPVPRHPPHHRLGRRSDADEPGLCAAARADGGRDIPPGFCAAGAAGPELRRVAVSSADRRS